MEADIPPKLRAASLVGEGVERVELTEPLEAGGGMRIASFAVQRGPRSAA